MPLGLTFAFILVIIVFIMSSADVCATRHYNILNRNHEQEGYSMEGIMD